MKRVVSLALAALLAFSVIISLSGCSKYYCDPSGKEWHNNVSLPSIPHPFNEIYDGSYSIKIDEQGNVLFKSLDGEEIKGSITVTPNAGRSSSRKLLNLINKYSSSDIVIRFENGVTSTGSCYQSSDGRSLSFKYGDRYYGFTDKQRLSKEEFLAYRAEFVEFLQSVYDSGVFPTREEIEANDLYCEYTYLYQIDPCCGGPIVYTAAQKATVEKVDLGNNEITVKIGEESHSCLINENIIIVNVNGDNLERLSAENLVKGDCLVVGHFNDRYAQIEEIFYFQND